METNDKPGQETAMVAAEPQKEHRWLMQMLGEWTMDGEMTMKPGDAPEKFTGTASVTAMGELWTLARGEMPTPDGTHTSLTTLGYDPQKKRFVGSFISSMMTNLWVYEGTLDAAGKTVTMDTEGPDFKTEGKLVKYQDLYEIRSPDHWILSSRMPGEDGKWNTFMTANYRRKK
jgi:hypothetical protein